MSRGVLIYIYPAEGDALPSFPLSPWGGGGRGGEGPGGWGEGEGDG